MYTVNIHLDFSVGIINREQAEDKLVLRLSHLYYIPRRTTPPISTRMILVILTGVPCTDFHNASLQTASHAVLKSMRLQCRVMLCSLTFSTVYLANQTASSVLPLPGLTPIWVLIHSTHYSKIFYLNFNS